MKKYIFICLTIIFITNKSSATITLTNILGNNNLPTNSFCKGDYMIINFTSDLPYGTLFVARLKKGYNVLYTSAVSNGNYIYFTIPTNNSIIPGSDYNVDIVSAQESSLSSTNFSIGLTFNVKIEASYSYCPGTTKTLKAIVNDCNGNLIAFGITYQWQESGNNIPNETNSTFTISEYYSYTCLVTINGITKSSNQVAANFSNTTLNTNLTVSGDNYTCTGSPKKLNVSYISNTSTYKWFKDGVLINGQENNYLDAIESGTYSVEVNELNCTFYPTNPVYVSFSQSIKAPINFEHGDSTVCVGRPVTIIAKNSKEYSYTWQKDGVNTTLFNNDTLSSFIQTSLPGVYRVIYKQGNCVSISNELTVVSSNTSQKPIISKKTALEICNGYIKIDQVNSALVGNWYRNNQLLINNFSNEIITNISGTYKMKYGIGNCEVESNEVILNFGSTISPNIIGDKTFLCGDNDLAFLRINTENMPYFRDYCTIEWYKDDVLDNFPIK